MASSARSSQTDCHPAVSSSHAHGYYPAVLDELPSLSHQPRRLPVIADGRCSVASVLLACRMIDDAHINKRGEQTIDTERRRLGRAMVDKWTEAD